MTGHRSFVLAAVLGAGLLLAGCSSSTSNAPSGSPTTGPGPSDAASAPLGAEPTASAPSTQGGGVSTPNMSGGMYVLITNRTHSVWKCYDWVEEVDPVYGKKVKKQREQFVLQPGQAGRYGSQSGSSVDIDNLDCSVTNGNLYGMHLYIRADNPWYANPWVDTSLVDYRRDVPAGSCFNNSKCAVWHTHDTFKKEGSRGGHRYQQGGFDLTLWRGRKDGDKNIEINVVLDAI